MFAAASRFSIAWPSPFDLGLDAGSTETVGGDEIPSDEEATLSPKTSSWKRNARLVYVLACRDGLPGLSMLT